MISDLLRPVSVLLFAASLAFSGCATVAPTHTGFVANYNELQPVSGHAKDEFHKVVATAPYHHVILTPVQLSFDQQKSGLNPEQVEAIRAVAQTEFLRALGASFAVITSVVDAPTLEFHAAITRVGTSNPIFNAVTTVALFVPVNNGGICVEWQALDALTHAIVAEGVSVANGKPWELAGAFQKTGHARSGLKKVAHDVADFLRQADHPLTQKQTLP